MTGAVMGRVRSPQADRIRDLYRDECATSMHRRVLDDGTVRVAFFREGSPTAPVSVWLVPVDGEPRQIEAGA